MSSAIANTAARVERNVLIADFAMKVSWGGSGWRFSSNFPLSAQQNAGNCTDDRACVIANPGSGR